MFSLEAAHRYSRNIPVTLSLMISFSARRELRAQSVGTAIEVKR